MVKFDHFVYFHPDLQDGIDFFQDTFGLKAEIGGQHIGRGTWNALFALEDGAYFEIISLDPKQHPFTKPRWMGLDNFKHPQLIRWAVAVDDLKEAHSKVNFLKLPIGNIESGSRKLANGETLQWQLTTPAMHDQIEPMPFLIEWTGAIHPSKNKTTQASIDKLILYDPEAEELQQKLAWLKLDIEFITNPIPKIELVLNRSNQLLNIGK